MALNGDEITWLIEVKKMKTTRAIILTVIGITTLAIAGNYILFTQSPNAVIAGVLVVIGELLSLYGITKLPYNENRQNWIHKDNLEEC